MATLNPFLHDEGDLYSQVQECFFPWLTEDPLSSEGAPWEEGSSAAHFEFPAGQPCQGSLCRPANNFLLLLPYACDMEGSPWVRGAVEEGRVEDFARLLLSLREVIMEAMAAHDWHVDCSQDSSLAPASGGIEAQGSSSAVVGGGAGVGVGAG